MNRRTHQPDIDPAIRSWIDNVLVPAMVKEFIADGETKEALAAKPLAVPQSVPLTQRIQ